MTTAAVPSDRVLTVPNALSALRLAGVPLFLWLALGPRQDGAALGVLAFAGVSDYLDGKLARVLNQTSRLGVLLDPLADRLYILATIVALTVRDVVPWWFAAALVGRDVFLVLSVPPPVLRRLGLGTALPVHYLGKAATFNLLYALPLLLLSAGDGWPAAAARPVGWAFAIWGTALYWWSGLLYAMQFWHLVRGQAGDGWAGGRGRRRGRSGGGR
jgi:CDP-diacylglycerol--glycerol-3-phosphate 3-phosphatidyltransferase